MTAVTVAIKSLARSMVGRKGILIARDDSRNDVAREVPNVS